jgi:hypothetical protein
VRRTAKGRAAMTVTLEELAKESTEQLEERRAFLRVRMDDLVRMVLRYREELADTKNELAAVNLNLRARRSKAKP